MLKRVFNYTNSMLLLKSVLYRFAGTLTTFLIAFILTGNAKLSFSVGVLEAVSKIVLYYLYDKFWTYLTYKIDLWRKYSKL